MPRRKETAFFFRGSGYDVDSMGLSPKAALGRGLGSLMPRSGAALAETDSEAKPGTLSPGMATLLRGNGHQKGAEAEPRRENAPPPEEVMARPNPLNPEEVAIRRLYQVSLILADSLLLGLAAWIALSARGQFGILHAVLCAASVSVGCWLTCLALWME